MNKTKATAASPADEFSLEPAGATGEETGREIQGEPLKPTLRVLVADEQAILKIDRSRLHAAVSSVLRESSYESGTVSIAVVDDPTIREINRRYLEHDYPTDVLSFLLEDRQPFLEGELVVSADTASRNAAEYGWAANSELLLYVIHGALHLVGYRDKQADETAAMRTAEAKHLRALGVKLPNGTSRWSGVAQSTGLVNASISESVRESRPS